MKGVGGYWALAPDAASVVDFFAATVTFYPLSDAPSTTLFTDLKSAGYGIAWAQ
jgi:hypothetical protein